MSEAERRPGCGVGIDLAVSHDERQRIESIVEAERRLPHITGDEALDRYLDDNPARGFWSDEFEKAPESELMKYKPAKMMLPGFGDRYDGSEGQIPCGANIPHLCESCGGRIDVGRTCARSECPRCAAAWVLKRSPKNVARICEAARMKSAAMGPGHPCFKHHGGLMPPDELLLDSPNPLEVTIQFVHDFMDIIDMDGVIMYHPFSGDNPGHEDDRGKWKERMFAGRSWEDVRSELKYRPHFHIIGACPWFPGQDVTSKIYEETGWLIRRFTERNGSPVSLGDMSDVARAFTYALSHTGIDTSGERNRVQMRRHGSAFHNADLRSLEKAKQAVHYVAPQTLGIPSMEMECQNEVLDDEDDETDHLSADDLEDDGDGPEETTSETTDSTKTCRGEIVTIDEADRLLDDEEWRRTIHQDTLEKAEETRKEWEDAGGWRGWVDDDDQAHLTEKPPPE